jgi:hypothetical protein
MKSGDLVKMWRYPSTTPAIGIVLEVKRKTCTLMTNVHGILEIPKKHVSKEVVQ